MSGAFEPFVERLMRRYLGDGERMLDIGCGPATYRRVCPDRYIGSDISDRNLSADMPRAPDIVAAGDRLPFAAGSFDLVMCKSTLYMMPDPPLALADFHRVLKPGGRLLLIDYNRRVQRRLQKALHTRYPCWTQWHVLSLVRRCGFAESRLLAAAHGEMTAAERWWRPLAQELFGTWAIVLGLK
jgi:ubiquinone/menaquinone biosynthesis C-methylase UbiE